MNRVIPDFSNRSADSIVSENIYFESSGYIYRSLSWVDLAKRKNSAVAFQYAAHDARQGIEQLLFEELVLSVGTKLDRTEYKKCIGNSTKLHAIINRMAPEREKLAKFNQAIFSVGSTQLSLIVWDHKLLMKYWGKLSKFLHWSGSIDETIKVQSWIDSGIITVEEACKYIWENQTKHETGLMIPSDMHPDICNLWERYKADKIGIEEVKIASKILDAATY